MKTTIVTLAYNRPDFIELQLNSIKKWVKEFEYIVFDNAPDDSVKDECKRLGLICLPVKLLGADPSWTVGQSLNKMWTTIQYLEGVVVYLDSDMFLIGPLPDMEEYDFAFVPQVRPEGILYPWTGLMLFNMETLPEPYKLRWEVDYTVKGADVGGLNHFYLKDNNVKVLNLEMWTLIDEEKYSFNGVDVTAHHTNYDAMTMIAKSFPRPYSFDMFKIKDREWFVLHYKSASNYPEFYTPDYNTKKTEAFKRILQ